MEWIFLEDSFRNTTNMTLPDEKNHPSTTDPTFWTTTFEIVNNESIANSTVPRNQNLSKYYPIMILEMLLSCLCLIFSLVVYSNLPEFKNVHGKNLITMSSCLLTTYLMLMLDLLIRKYVPFQVCFSMALIIHVTFLGTFYWTNVMAFDVWRKLTNMKPKSGIRLVTKTYLKYSVYAWTATILTVLPVPILELTDLVSNEYRPKLGTKRCWLNGRTAFYYYFSFPVGIILMCNLVLFMMTLWKLMVIKKMTERFQTETHQKRLILYLKLFLIMGIIWTSEFLPWITGIYWLYAIAGMLTTLHGVFLFLIFTCKRRILKQFYQKYFKEKETTSSSQSKSSKSTLASIFASNKVEQLENINVSKF